MIGYILGLILFRNLLPVVANNQDVTNNEIRMDGSIEQQFISSLSSRKNKIRMKPRVLGGSEVEVDDGPHSSEDECSKLLYTSISFMVEEAENLPCPDSPTEMYTSLLWSTGAVTENTANNVTTTEATTRTTSDTVSLSKRSADWENDGYFDFDNVCGEDKIIFQMYEENSGYLSSTDSSVELDTLIWRYSSQTSVETYYDMVGEATSCWYIERDSEPNYDTPDSTSLSKRDVYLKWCVKVKCSDGWSCYQPMSTWALITVLSLFLFPAVLCLCCLCCMSQKMADVVMAIKITLYKVFCCASIASLTGFQNNRRAVPQREVELEDRSRAQATRNSLRPPTPPRRTNHIKKHKETSLYKLKKSGVDIEENPVCAICLADLEKSDKVKRLSCNHIFHSGCVDLWGESAHTCPLCKTDFEELSLQQQEEDEASSSSSSRSSSRIFPSFDAGMFMLRGFNRPMRVPAGSTDEVEASL
jgi:hypothetical protein